MSREFSKRMQIKIYVYSSLNHKYAPIGARNSKRHNTTVQQKVSKNHIFLTLRNSTYLYRSKKKKKQKEKSFQSTDYKTEKKKKAEGLVAMCVHGT